MAKIDIPEIFEKSFYILNYRRFLDILSIIFFVLVCSYKKLSIGGMIVTFGIFFLLGFVYILKYVLNFIDTRRSYISHIDFHYRDVCWFVISLLSLLWVLVSDITIVPICFIFIVRWIRSFFSCPPNLLTSVLGIKYGGENETYILMAIVFFVLKIFGVPILGYEYIGFLSFLVVLSCYSGVKNISTNFEICRLFSFYVLEGFFRYLISDIAYWFLYWATLDYVWNCILMLI